MIERQLCWFLGIVNTKRILTPCLVTSHHITSLMLTICINRCIVDNLSPLTLRWNRTRGGKKCERGVAYLNNCHLSTFILHRHQIGIDSLSLIANETIVALNGKIIFQRMPGFKKRILESISMQTIYENGVNALTMIVVASQNLGIIV